MVWLEKREVLALEEVKSTWNLIREAPNLSNLNRPTFGFRVTKPFRSAHPNGRFLPGMQGQVLNCTRGQAYVEVRDLFDAKGKPLKEWISKDCIQIGVKKYGTWQFDVSTVPRTSSKLTGAELSQLNDPKYQHIARGISAFLKTLAKTKPKGLSDDNLNRLGGVTGSKVSYITSQVLDGIEKAGLIKVLNDPNFTSKDLMENATLDCGTSAARDECGLYFRCYSEVKANQAKKDSWWYIGQSAWLNKRYHKWASEGHSEVKERGNLDGMRAICLVSRVFYDDHKYIVEQLFTSLLQTYKEEILYRTRNVDLSDDDAQELFHARNCRDMDNIAEEAARQSGWTGAVGRKTFWQDQFGACRGLNWSSPMAESPSYEPSLWLRTDAFMPDMDNAGEAIPVSNFIRDTPKKMTVIQPAKKQASQEPSFIIFDLRSDGVKDYRMRISRTLPSTDLQKGTNWPVENTFFNVVFEVRTDWQPHPYSWARLPLIGPFEDWDRANSWAMSINWTDPSGNFRTKYLHCERPFSMMCDTDNGSIQAYARGIEVVHWLFKERIRVGKQNFWQQTVPMAYVKVIKHDHVSQLIKLDSSDPVTETPPISSQRKHPDEIKDQMEGKGSYASGGLGLANVGRTLAEARKATSVKFGTRSRCDTCMFTKEACSIIQDKVCKTCLHTFGRPFCSWTPGVPSQHVTANSTGNSFEALEANGDMANIARRTALHGLKGWIGNTIVSADPVMIAVDEGDDFDEMSDADFDAAVAAADAVADTQEGEWLGP